jgi:hypothetical protein
MPDISVLVIGFDPAALPGHDPAASAPAFEHARVVATQEHVYLAECLIGLDESAEGQIVAALRQKAWDCVVIGGGIRKPEPALPFFERVVNLTRQHAPGAAIACNTSPADTVEAAKRALAASEPQA